jgi:hypothetical protein
MIGQLGAQSRDGNGLLSFENEYASAEHVSVGRGGAPE